MTSTDTAAAFSHVLFPGRHHLVTRFQVAYLRALLAGLITDQDGHPVRVAPEAQIVWAVTSANHAGTRRNPVPANRREALIERVSALERLPSLVVPVVDTAPTARFASTVVETVAATTGHRPTPADTLVACSTPAVAAMYTALGYACVSVEADQDPEPARPWDVLSMLVSGDSRWRDLTHPAAVEVYDRYHLDDHVVAVCTDPVVSSEGDLTATRDYRTYADAFEVASQRKWDQISGFVQPGRIVDLGCATGGLLERAAATPALHESDLYGVDVARHLIAEAEHKKNQGVFTNPSVFFLQRNILRGPVFPDATIDTTITLALTHEIASYGNGVTDLAALTARIRAHTAPGGVWINSDVLGPADPTRLVRLTLDDADGANVPPVDLTGWEPARVSDHVAGLSTRARLDQFAVDFPALSGAVFAPVPVPGHSDAVDLPLGQAMEYLYTKDYHDNWSSECHERFCDMTFNAWRDLVTTAGFSVDPASRAWRNDWIVTQRLDPVAALTDPCTGAVVDWPDTHVLLVARRSIDLTQ